MVRMTTVVSILLVVLGTVSVFAFNLLALGPTSLALPGGAQFAQLPGAALFALGLVSGAVLLGGGLIAFSGSLPTFLKDDRALIPIGRQMLELCIVADVIALTAGAALIAATAMDPVAFRHAGLSIVLAAGGVGCLLVVAQRLSRGETIQAESHWGGIGGGLGGGLGGWRISGALLFAAMGVVLLVGAAAADYAPSPDRGAPSKPAADKTLPAVQPGARPAASPAPATRTAGA